MKTIIPGSGPLKVYPSGRTFLTIPGSGPVQSFKPGLSYLLREDASVPHAAGDFAAGDVAMSPGPGTWRQGVEAGHISVVDGWIEFASAAAYHYLVSLTPITSTPRPTGQVIMFRWRCASTSVTNPAYVLSLWDAMAGVRVHGIYLQNGVMYACNVGQADIPILPSFTLNTAYDSTIVLTATSAYYFYKLATDTAWTFQWFSPGSITNTPLYPAIEGYDAAFSVKNIRAPRSLYNIFTGQLLMETGDNLLLESGDYLLLEASYG